MLSAANERVLMALDGCLADRRGSSRHDVAAEAGLEPGEAGTILELLCGSGYVRLIGPEAPHEYELTERGKGEVLAAIGRAGL